MGIHLEADHDALPNCTLVDALIVPKEDGEWPEWAQDEAREWAIYFTKPAGFLVLPEDLFDNLRGLYEAAKETP